MQPIRFVSIQYHCTNILLTESSRLYRIAFVIISSTIPIREKIQFEWVTSSFVLSIDLILKVGIFCIYSAYLVPLKVSTFPENPLEENISLSPLFQFRIR